MHKRNISIIGIITIFLVGCSNTNDNSKFSFTKILVPKRSVKVTEFGAKGDSKTLNSNAIQKAIDHLHKLGGGKVIIPAGKFLTGTIELKNNIELHLEKDAYLLGSKNFAHYKLPDFFIDATGQQRGWCLIGIIDATNVKITGYGTIDGQGKTFYGKRPFLIRCVRSSNIEVANLTLLNSGAWVSHYYQSKNIYIHGVSITSHVNGNNDGMDIDSCQNVLIEKCKVDTGDDAICLKSTSPMPCENITVRNCQLKSNWGAFKMGTESMGDFKNITVSDCYIHDTKGGAIKILAVDGANIRNLVINNIKVKNSDMTLFIRSGKRLRVYRKGDKPRKPGTINGVKITNITSDTSPNGNLEHPTGIFITGQDDLCVSNIYLDNIKIKLQGGGKTKHIENFKKIVEITPYGNYPEYIYFTRDKEKVAKKIRHKSLALPAYGIYARHLRNSVFKNIKISTKVPDKRACIYLEDVKNLTINKPNSSTLNGPIIKKFDCKDIQLKN